ncbi:TonB-dependent receptor domain-containing protein [Alteromonas hispanica]|uniref:TonB-dependent receptor n=1 Tax=Alteromonas hispanica TaxID=315421 RepID=A0A6L9MS59_9ALTE|nr:TonB-dependent receptor [Alteromonas hispanica]NDW20735.1 TonB-dependent receptor [Alteromonas hispanica]
MFKNSKLATSVKLACVFGSALAVSASNLALAQEVTNDDATAEEAVEKITVTGSRLRRVEVSESAPIFSFGNEDIQVRGFTNAADLLNQSPLFGGSLTPEGDQAAANAGQNQANIFDLGTQRTLTLVNGRRMVSSQSASIGGGQVDINTIPVALIDRIEVVPLTGAATYGADAIGGTVNVILKDDYEGFEVTAQYGDNDAGNAREFQFSMVGGGNFDDGRGNITFGAEYTRTDGLLECEQDFLCNNNPGSGGTTNEFLDRNGDGAIDDVNGDGVIDDADLQSVSLFYDEVNLQLFTDFGAVTPAFAGFAPSVGSGAWPDGNFYEFTQDGQIQQCNAGPRLPSGRALLETYDDGRGNICSIDFFDSVSQIRSPTSRHNLYASFNYDLLDNLRFKSDVVYANTSGTELVNQGGFQTGFFGGTSAAITLPTSNPFLSPQALSAMQDAGLEGDQFSVHRFNNDLVSLGGNSNETHTWRISNIFEGEFEALDRDFYWDVSVVHGRSDVNIRTTGIVDGRFLNAVDARSVDDEMLETIRQERGLDTLDDALLALQNARSAFTGGFQRGDIICGAYADLAAGTLEGFNSRASGSGLTDEDLPFLDGCQPLNLFGSQASPESLDFITGGSQMSQASNMQTVYTANLGGTAFELPAGPLDFVVGVERRIEKSEYEPAVGGRVPITRSAIDRPVNGGYDTNEWYVEFVAPVISSDMDIPFVQYFELSGAYRNQEFNTSAPAGFQDRTTEEDVVQASLKWLVNDEVSLRATYATAFRNPSINELFQPLQQAFISGDDPCDARYVGLGPNPSARKANCESLGIDTDTFTSSISDGTISTGYVSGNPELGAETSTSYTYGLAWTPEYVENLQIGLDYYNLEIEGAINDVTFETLAANCYDSPDFPNEPACDTFTRGDDFQVIRAGNRPANVALATFEAVSLSIFYSYDLGEYGQLRFQSATQHNITNENQATATSEVQEDVGDFADPKWTGTFDINWFYEDWFVSHRVRWQNETLIDALEQQLYSYNYERQEDGSLTGNFTNENSSRFLHDLSIGYTAGTSTTIQLNIQNLLDRTADDLSATSFGFNQFGLDERLGRRFSLRVNHKF